MANKVIMPKQGLQMTEGTIVKWLAAEGEQVKEGEPLFEIETDKVTITIDSPYSGVLLKIIKEENEVVPIAETVAVIGEIGEDISNFVDIKSNEQIFIRATTIQVKSEEKRKPGQSDKPFITPRAKRLAEEKGINYCGIQGSGADGEIIEKDILPLLSVIATPIAKRMTDSLNGITGSGINGKITKSDVMDTKEKQPDTIVPIIGMRKAISDNMMNSLHGMAQANHKIKVDMSEAAKIRATYKLKEQPVSYNDIFIKVLSHALMEFPQMNAVTQGNQIHQKHYVNMGVAVAVENGLIVPTVQNTHIMTLPQIHDEVSKKIALAKSGKLTKADYREGTFTITNLGMFGLDEFTAIVNPPQVGILAVGAICDTPIVRNGQIVIRPMVTLSLTYDHRIVDGAPAAEFISRVKELLENPYLFIFS